MIQGGLFKSEDLILCRWQYLVSHTNTECFTLGEVVFLKSNPEHQMSVHSINEDSITTKWRGVDNEIQTCEFPPACILQYKYAGLLTSRSGYNISLN